MQIVPVQSWFVCNWWYEYTILKKSCIEINAIGLFYERFVIDRNLQIAQEVELVGIKRASERGERSKMMPDHHQ